MGVLQIGPMLVLVLSSPQFRVRRSQLRRMALLSDKYGRLYSVRTCAMSLSRVVTTKRVKFNNLRERAQVMSTEH